MNITLNYSDLYDLVERSLSIIGKRSTDEDGNRLFLDITLGSREKDIIKDFLRMAVVNITNETSFFLAGEQHTVTHFGNSIKIDFWTDKPNEELKDSLTDSGQLIYNYVTHTLYKTVYAYPFDIVAKDAANLFLFEDKYYKWTVVQPADEEQTEPADEVLTELTDEELAELTDEEKTAAITLTYFDSDPADVDFSEADVFCYYEGAIYKSSQTYVFEEQECDDNTAYFSPDRMIYQWLYGTMQRIPDTTIDTVVLTLDMPSNHNHVLSGFIEQACINYCVAYTLFSWFTITAPRLSEKYQSDAVLQLAAITRMSVEKKASETSYTYKDVTGSVINTPNSNE